MKRGGNIRRFERLSSFLAELDPEIVLHFSRYHPAYKMTIPPTPPQTLVRAAEIASRKLKYVFIGNIEIPQWANSYCPHCRALLIQREGFYTARVVDVENGSCRKCGNKVNIVN